MTASLVVIEDSISLARYDAMCRAIDAAYQVDEVKDIRDKALAFEHYARQARNTEAERQACEIRLRAERKAGQLLAETEKAKGGRPSENRRDDTGGFQPKTLKQMGVSEDQSRRWQKLADVPDEAFEEALSGTEMPTTSGIIGGKKKTATDPIDDMALWIWGRLRDFERDGVLAANPSELRNRMTGVMCPDVRRLAPLVSDWLRRLLDDQ